MVRVKICGLRHAEHIAAAVEAGVDGIGLVLAPSVRQVTVDEAARLLESVPASIERFAVFRMPDEATVRAIAALPFTVLQGEAGYRGPVPDGWRFMPTWRNDGQAQVPQREPGAHWMDGMVLVDGPGEAGEGVAGDWQRAHDIARRGPLMLAGGLSPDNVAMAVRAVRPVAVDVSSGVEATRGHKDPERFVTFVRAARS